MLLRAVGGMTDTLHRPSGHLVTNDSLQAVCTWNKNPHITRGHSLLHTWPAAMGGMGWPAVPTGALTGPRRGRAHSPWPCTTGSASPAGAARCRRSCHTPCTWHSQAGFLPATGEAWQSADQAEHALGMRPSAPHTGHHKTLVKNAPRQTQPRHLLNTGRGRTGRSHPLRLPQHSMTHRDWTEPPNAEREQLGTTRKRTKEEGWSSWGGGPHRVGRCPVHTPSSSSMISFPMEASVVHLQLLVARTAHRLWALNLHTVRE